MTRYQYKGIILTLAVFPSAGILQLLDAAEEAAPDPEAVHVPAHPLGQLEQPGRDLPARDLEALGPHQEEEAERKRGGLGRHEAAHSHGDYSKLGSGLVDPLVVLSILIVKAE